jgi:TRAP-type C4-dicarboxylate transport system substrate-binding protein
MKLRNLIAGRDIVAINAGLGSGPARFLGFGVFGACLLALFFFGQHDRVRFAQALAALVITAIMFFVIPLVARAERPRLAIVLSIAFIFLIAVTAYAIVAALTKKDGVQDDPAPDRQNVPAAPQINLGYNERKPELPCDRTLHLDFGRNTCVSFPNPCSHTNTNPERRWYQEYSPEILFTRRIHLSRHNEKKFDPIADAAYHEYDVCLGDTNSIPSGEEIAILRVQFPGFVPAVVALDFRFERQSERNEQANAGTEATLEPLPPADVAASASRDLTIVTFASGDDLAAQSLKAVSERSAGSTNGSMRLRIVLQPRDEQQPMKILMQNPGFDGFLGSANELANFVDRSITVFQTLFFFENPDDLEYAVAHVGALESDIEVDGRNFVLLGWMNNGWVGHFSLFNPPERMRRFLQYRTPYVSGEVHGASTIAERLQYRDFDGLLASPADLVASKEIVDVLSNGRYRLAAPDMFLLILRSKTWEELSIEDAKLLETLAREEGKKTLQKAAARHVHSISLLRSEGLALAANDLAFKVFQEQQQKNLPSGASEYLAFLRSGGRRGSSSEDGDVLGVGAPVPKLQLNHGGRRQIFDPSGKRGIDYSPKLILFVRSNCRQCERWLNVVAERVRRAPPDKHGKPLVVVLPPNSKRELEKLEREPLLRKFFWIAEDPTEHSARRFLRSPVKAPAAFLVGNSGQVVTGSLNSSDEPRDLDLEALERLCDQWIHQRPTK